MPTGFQLNVYFGTIYAACTRKYTAAQNRPERQGHGSAIEVIWNNQERLRRVQEEGGAENCWVAEVIDSPDNDR